MKYLLFIIVFWSSGLAAQESFIKLIDHDEERTGYQISEYDGRFFALSGAIFNNQFEGSILMEIDSHANVIWEKRLPWLDVAPNSMMFNDDIIAVSGNNNPAQTDFYLHHMSIDGGDSLATYIIDDDSIDLYEMFVLNSMVYNGQYVIAGSARRPNTAYGIIFKVDFDGMVDTLFIADQNDRNTDIWKILEDQDGNLVAFFDQQYDNGDNVRSIKKYNADLEEIWSYTSESLFLNLSNPRGVELHDGRIAFTYGNPDNQHELHSIRTINPDMTLSWQYDWTHLDNQARYIYGLEKANDGAIYAMGDYSHVDFPPPYVREAPFIIKLSPDGEKIWERAYLEYDENGDNKRGLIFDLEELDDGSIMAIGKQNNENGDIMIMRLDADGCLMESCGQNVEFTDVDDLIQEEILVYPNPVSDLLHIETDIQLSEMRLSDITGQVHVSGIFQDHLDISHLPSGIYFLTLSDEEGRQVHERVVVE